MYSKRYLVELPPEENTIFQKSSGATYVYYYTEMRWDPQKKKTVDNRVAVGKLCSYDQSKMYPNEEWMNRLKMEIPEAKKTAKYMNVGPYLCLFSSAEKIGCLQALRDAFPDHWNKIFALCVYVIDDQSAVAQQFSFWGYHNYCGFSAPFSDSTISNLYEFISENDWAIDEFYERFQKNYRVAIGKPSDTAIVACLDSTNRLNRCKYNKYTGRGHPKVKGTGLPQVNTALVVDEETGIPLYLEEFHGSILDKTQTPITTGKMRSLGFSKLIVATDSGYAAQDSVESLDEDFEFTVMTPESFNVHKTMFAKYAKIIEKNEKYYIPEEDVYGICEENFECFGGKYNAYLFFDPQRAEAEVHCIHEKAKVLLALANTHKFYTENFVKNFAPHVIITRIDKDPITGKTFKAALNAEIIQEEIDNAGFFTVVANVQEEDGTGKKNPASPGTIIRIQRMRDQDEKSFCRFKDFFGMDSSGTHNTMTYVGKDFMAFVAMVVESSFQWYAKPFLTAKTSTTVATTIGALRCYQMGPEEDKKRKPATALTKSQKEIFDCFNMDESKIKEKLNALPLEPYAFPKPTPETP